MERRQDFRDFQHKRETDRLVASRNRWLEHQGKRVALQERLQRDVNYEGTVAKAPPCPERRMRTPLPQQSSSSTRDEDSTWSGHERTAFARMEQYVKNSECIQLDIEEVEEWSFGLHQHRREADLIKGDERRQKHF